MLQLLNLSLPTTAQNQLIQWQGEIDRIPNYKDRVKSGKELFGKRNRPSNTTFRKVRQILVEMCSGARRCGYCEDSVADQVEHIAPKDLYPEAVFVWENYLYACGQCNNPKSNQYAVFSHETGNLVEVTRINHQRVFPPELGSPVLINPRFEDPLQFLELDLLGTFYFLPAETLNSRDRQRAEYTLDVLRLNDRDYLLAARAEAFDSYRARLYEYVSEKKSGSPQDLLDTRIKALRKMQHPTVWQEMQRQQAWLPELKELFDRAPEALTW
jgi:uncharacterized protein (TIGR02646 family)